MDHEALLRELYAAFNARDVDAVLAALHPEVTHVYTFRGGLVVRMDVSET